MKVKLCIHLGYPKTGTTSLQQGFFPVVDDVIYLGKIGEGGFSASYDILSEKLINDICFIPNKLFERQYSQIDKSTFEEGKRYVLSEENFIFNCIRPINKELGGISKFETILKNLQHIFPKSDFELSFILVYREQVEVIESLYAQSYNNYYRFHDELNTIDNFVKFITKPNSSYGPILEPSVLEGMLISIFDKPSIKIISHELLSYRPSCFYKEICQFLQVPHSEYENIVKNKRASAKGGKRARQLSLYSYIRHLKSLLFPNLKISSNNYLAVFLKKIKIPSNNKCFSLSPQNVELIKNYYNKSA